MKEWQLYALLAAAVLVVAGLAFYAGKLLFQVKKQTDSNNQVRQKRIDDICESIQVIAKAVSQQQCNLSEACIRFYHLLEGIPVLPQPDYKGSYPSVYELYEAVKNLPTHDERKALSRQERDEQDKNREQKESELETSILKEVEQLMVFSVDKVA